MPALLTSTSTWPSPATASSTTRSAVSGSERSPPTSTCPSPCSAARGRSADAIILHDAPAPATTAARREATTRHDAWHREAEAGTVERGAGPVPGPWHALGRAAVEGVPAPRPIEKGHHDHGDHDR